MPSKCWVPFCKGNYTTGPKVSVYSFPKNQEVKQKWLKVIQKANFQPTRASKVCELHFKETDFEKCAVGYNEKTGDIITVPLQVWRLKKSAVPSVFPKYPASILSTAQKSREKADKRRIEKEMKKSQAALNTSIQKYEEPVLEFVGFDALEDNSPNNDSPTTPPELNAQDIKQEVTEQTDRLQLNTKEEKTKAAASKRKQPVETELQEALDQASTASRNDEEDECDLYGKLIAKKLRKLPESQRERMMYEIQGLFLKCSQYR